MRNRGCQGKQKATADTVTFQDEQGRCLIPFGDILAHFARKAKSTLRANGRVERALEIATDARNVKELNDYETFLIHSQNGGGWYRVDGQGCQCKDYQYNGGPCKHQIARWLVIRAQQADGTRRPVEELRQETSPASDFADLVASGETEDTAAEIVDAADMAFEEWRRHHGAKLEARLAKGAR